MRLLVMRHGATRANDLHCYAGRRTDEPLSERGIEQCSHAGTSDWGGTVYTSLMLRARQTAQLCFPRAHMVGVPGLEEFDFGVFEGRSAKDMEHDEAYTAWVNSGCVAPCPGGDSLGGYCGRTRATLHGLLARAEQRGEELVVVVGHGGTVMAAVDGFFDKGVGNCEGYVATVCLHENDFSLEDVRRFATLPV